MHASLDEEENANELQFGDIDFNNVKPLSLDELYAHLKHPIYAGLSNDLFNQTIDYLEKVVTTKVPNELETLNTEIRQKLTNLKLTSKPDGKLAPLHPFEISAITNLIRAEDITPEELTILIPSLSRFLPDQIQLAINIVIEAKSRITGGILV